MKLKLWGVRGSIASPGAETAKYGGNTSCYEVINSQGDRIIMDAGTGIRKLGLELMKSLPLKCSLLISHTHWDHIQGFPFFIPIFVPGNTLEIYAPRQFERTLESVMTAQMDYSVFPVRTAELSADIRYHNIIEGPVEGIEGFEVMAQFMCHPVTTAAYRVTADDKSIVYTGDHEKFFDQYHKGIATEDIDPEVQAQMQEIVDTQNNRVVEFCRGTDVLIIDAMYTNDEYAPKEGWGHSTVEMDLELAVAANVKRVILTHHDPIRTDQQLDAIEIQARKYLDKLQGHHIELSIAKEGEEFEL